MITDKKDIDKQIKNKCINFILFLIFLALFLFYSKKHFTKKIITYSKLVKILLPYLYMFLFAIISGLLFFFGLENINIFLEKHISFKNKNILNLITASFVGAFCFFYVGTSKDILQTIGAHEIQFNTFKNVIGFIAGRILIVIILFIKKNI